MEAKCHLRYQRFGRRKVAQLLDAVRGKSLYEADGILQSLPRIATDIVGKAIKSAGVAILFAVLIAETPSLLRVSGMSSGRYQEPPELSRLSRADAQCHSH